MAPQEVVQFLTLEVVQKLTLERPKRGTETNSPVCLFFLWNHMIWPSFLLGSFWSWDCDVVQASQNLQYFSAFRNSVLPGAGSTLYTSSTHISPPPKPLLAHSFWNMHVANIPTKNETLLGNYVYSNVLSGVHMWEFSGESRCELGTLRKNLFWFSFREEWIRMCVWALAVMLKMNTRETHLSFPRELNMLLFPFTLFVFS